MPEKRNLSALPLDTVEPWHGRKVFDYETGAYLGRADGEHGFESDAIVSGFTHQKKGEHVACEHRRVRPAEASRTPIAFRDLLLGIARSCQMRTENGTELTEALS